MIKEFTPSFEQNLKDSIQQSIKDYADDLRGRMVREYSDRLNKELCERMSSLSLDIFRSVSFMQSTTELVITVKLPEKLKS
mgnify:CR=1 FL=1